MKFLDTNIFLRKNYSKLELKELIEIKDFLTKKETYNMLHAGITPLYQEGIFVKDNIGALITNFDLPHNISLEDYININFRDYIDNGYNLVANIPAPIIDYNIKDNTLGLYCTNYKEVLSKSYSLKLSKK